MPEPQIAARDRPICSSNRCPLLRQGAFPATRRPPAAAVLLAAALLLTVGPVPRASAADCVDYSKYLHLAASIPASEMYPRATAAGGFAYVIDGSVLKVMDVSDPALPEQVGNLPLGGSPMQAAMQGTYLYIAAEIGRAHV